MSPNGSLFSSFSPDLSTWRVGRVGTARSSPCLVGSSKSRWARTLLIPPSEPKCSADPYGRKRGCLE
eukprot:6985435-Alexandrium_andersonii.AAC.1